MKTYKGKTAGGYLKTARIHTMKAGNFEIISADAPGNLIYKTEYDTMVMRDIVGIVCELGMSNRALERLEKLEAEMEAKYQA